MRPTAQRLPQRIRRGTDGGLNAICYIDLIRISTTGVNGIQAVKELVAIRSENAPSELLNHFCELRGQRNAMNEIYVIFTRNKNSHGVHTNFANS